MENNNRPFFDPYSTASTAQTSQNAQVQNQTQSGIFKFPEVPDIGDADGAITNATKYYEQQYMYYKYLNEVLNYKTKLYEYEKLVKPNLTKNQPPQR